MLHQQSPHARAWRFSAFEHWDQVWVLSQFGVYCTCIAAGCTWALSAVGLVGVAKAVDDPEGLMGHEGVVASMPPFLKNRFSAAAGVAFVQPGPVAVGSAIAAVAAFP